MKVLYLIIGWTSLALGLLGVLLPILPTTPFIILSAFCFSRGSPQMKKWLLQNPLFGKALSDWEKEGMIRKRPKAIAMGMLAVSAAIIVLKETLSLWIKLPLLLILSIVGLFIYSRPSQTRSESQKVL